MNAQVALTSQYGQNQNCSCWSSGCGELDVLEVLDSGNTRCKSTLHMWPAGGSSDYFERPVNDTIKVGVIFYGKGELATIQLLDDIVSFPEVLTAGYVEQFIADLPPPNMHVDIISRKSRTTGNIRIQHTAHARALEMFNPLRSCGPPQAIVQHARRRHLPCNLAA